MRLFDCPWASISSFLDCGVRRRPAWTTLAVECGAASIALDIHFEDGGVMDGGGRLLPAS
jgi:hypothetical protein